MDRYTLVYSDDVLTRQYLQGKNNYIVDVITPQNFHTRDWSSSVFVFTGGEDISPILYRQKPIHKWCPVKPTERDLFELAVIMAFPHSPKIGICRGAQMLWVAVGDGRLVQHVDGHVLEDHLTKATKHATSEEFPSLLLTNSDHHQALVNENTAQSWRLYYHTDVATKSERISTIEMAVIIKPTTCVLTQGHPEYPGAPTLYKEVFSRLVLKYIGMMI